MKAYLPWILSIAAIFIFNAALLFLDKFEAKIRADENNQPKVVQIKSLGVVHEFEVDNKTVTVKKDTK